MMSVEVAGGPTVGLKSTVQLPLYTQETTQTGDGSRSNRSGFFLEEIKEERSETSSIGACSSADEREEEEEVQSKANLSSLSSLDSLEESLPIKRGLSNFYSGKSKSFASLSNTANATAKDLIKPENPLNKRRRVQLMAAWSRTRRASCSSLVSSVAAGPPPLALPLSDCDEEEEEEEESLEKKLSLFTCTPLPLPLPLPLPIWGDHDNNNEKKQSKMPLRSPRPFSLSNLNKHAHH